MAALLVLLVFVTVPSCSCGHLPPAAVVIGPEAAVQPLVHREASLVRMDIGNAALRDMKADATFTSAQAGHPEPKADEDPKPDDGKCGAARILCSKAQPQSPRDVSPGAPGDKSPRFPPFGPPGVGSATERSLVQVNTHFHLGAEHRSAISDGYDVEHGGKAEVCDPEHDKHCPHHKITKKEIGYFCRDRKLFDRNLSAPFEWKYCHGVHVGNTYEIHWVYSTGGEKIGDGLKVTQTANNPHVAVRGQVYVVVNPESGATMGASSTNKDLMHSWMPPRFSVQYQGSTTGTKHDNECCSRTEVTWQVDQECHEISAQSMDYMCKVMVETYNMTDDTSAHGSRVIVSDKWVVPANYVDQLPSTPR